MVNSENAANLVRFIFAREYFDKLVGYYANNISIQPLAIDVRFFIYKNATSDKRGNRKCSC
jgi:hypothetical protein